MRFEITLSEGELKKLAIAHIEKQKGVGGLDPQDVHFELTPNGTNAVYRKEVTTP